MRTEWNTGRQYTADGQRIVATFDRDTGRALFTDYSRRISGTVDLSAIAEFIESPRDLQAAIMQAYDGNTYTPSVHRI